MNKVVVNPAYVDLYAFIKGLPKNFETINEIIQNFRNDIRICEVNGYKLVIKSFKGMYFPNRVAYSLFRKSKAHRSYEYSFRLQAKGILTPQPVGFIDCYQFGLLTTSYYISEYYEHTPLLEMIGPENEGQERNEEGERIVKDLAKFTLKLHLSGIYHEDYSNGNILCTMTGSQHTFALVDLNRIKFRNVDFKKGIMNFATLGIPLHTLYVLIKEYSRLAEENSTEAQQMLISNKAKRAKKRKIRSWFKKIIIKSRPSVHA